MSDKCPKCEAVTLPYHGFFDEDKLPYVVLHGPNGEEWWLTEPEDRTWNRDLQVVVDRLNEQHAQLAGFTDRETGLKAKDAALHAVMVWCETSQDVSRINEFLPEVRAALKGA